MMEVNTGLLFFHLICYNKAYVIRMDITVMKYQEIAVLKQSEKGKVSLVRKQEETAI